TLVKWHPVLCCAPAYLEAHAVPRVPADLSDHNCLLYAYSPFGPEFHFMHPGGNEVFVRITGNLVSTSIALMRTAAVAGLGLWLCPPYIVCRLLLYKKLGHLLPGYGRPEMEV